VEYRGRSNFFYPFQYHINTGKRMRRERHTRERWRVQRERERRREDEGKWG